MIGRMSIQPTRLGSGDLAGGDVADAGLSAPGSRRQWHRYQELRQPLQIEHPSDQQNFLLHLQKPAPPEAPKAVPVLGLAEQLLDLLPAPLRQTVWLPADPHPHPAMPQPPPRLGRRDVRLDPAAQQALDEPRMEKPLVRAHTPR